MESAVLAPPIEDPTDNRSVCRAFLQTTSLIHATNCSQITLLVSMVETSSADRAKDFLHFQVGMSRHLAVEMVDAAIALQHLPLISSAFERGDLTLTEVCLIAQFATPETDENLARTGNQYSLNQLKKLAADAKAKARCHPDKVRTHLGGKLKIRTTNTRLKGP